MNSQSLVVLAIIIACVIFAIRYMISNKDHCIGCSACKNGACSKCSKNNV